MVDRTLTAANSVYMLAVAGLYPVAQQLQGYATDDAFATEAQEIADVQMGVDGIMSAGYVPQPTRQSIMIQADSASGAIFDNWANAMRTAREILRASATIYIPSIGKKYTLTRGVLTSYVPIPGVKKVLQSRTFMITWESVAPAPL